MKYIISFFISALTILSQENVKLQNNNVYVGYGFVAGPQIGGKYGVGFEHFFRDQFSATIAVGDIGLDSSKIPDNVSRFNYDIGIRYYFTHDSFFSLNYGLISFESVVVKYDNKVILSTFKKDNDFSYSFGSKFHLNNRFYYTLYIGLAIKSKYNKGKLLRSSTFPRFGILLNFKI